MIGHVLPPLKELSNLGSDERSLLESLSNHIGAKGAKKKEHQGPFTYTEATVSSSTED